MCRACSKRQVVGCRCRSPQPRAYLGKQGKRIEEEAERLFAYRKRQAWPPTIVAGPEWSSAYEAALETMQDRSGILPTIDEAVAWANDLIARIAAARP